MDNLHTFAKQAKTVTGRVNGRDKILKSLAGSTWGKEKETLLATYKVIRRPLKGNACPF